MRLWVRPLALLSGLRIAMSCGVGRRRGSDPALLWLWRRLAATAPIRPLAQEPYMLKLKSLNIFKKYIFFFLLPFLGLLPATYGGSQARGRIRAVATGLHQSHSNAGSEPCLRPTPQLKAMQYP